MDTFLVIHPPAEDLTNNEALINYFSGRSNVLFIINLPVGAFNIHFM